MASSLHPSPPPSIFYTKALSTATLGLILGSTTWASVAVMPSLIAAPISTYSKLSVFDGLISRANKILPPVFLTSAASLGYLAYYYSTLPTSTSSLVTARESGNRYLVATAVMVACAGLQVVIVPKNDEMQAIVRRKGGKDDDGKEGNERVGELLRWNWARVGLSAVAFGLSIVELAM